MKVCQKCGKKEAKDFCAEKGNQSGGRFFGKTTTAKSQSREKSWIGDLAQLLIFCFENDPSSGGLSRRTAHIVYRRRGGGGGGGGVGGGGGWGGGGERGCFITTSACFQNLSCWGGGRGMILSSSPEAKKSL